MADMIVSPIIHKLSSILEQQVEKEVELVVGVGEEVKKLQRNLSAIQAVIEDAERKYVVDAAVRQWVDELKDVAYDIDDVLDEWNTAILKLQIDADHQATSKPTRTRKVCSCVPVSHCFGYGSIMHRRNIAVRIKELNKTLDEIAARKDRFFFSSTVRANIGVIERNLATSYIVEHDQRMTSSFIDQTKVVGRFEERERLIQMLIRESVERSTTLNIISIVGMGGIGKTSLAQQVYNDSRVQSNFKNRIWVCVSDPFDKKRVAKEILEGLGQPEPNLHGFDALSQSVSQHIKNKKFLLVLDDVWSEDFNDWDQLQNSLLGGLPGSSVLVTTRKQEVAIGTMRSTNLLDLAKLSDKECWDLFSKMAFYGWSNDDRERVEDVSWKIVLKCDGLPLAAKTIGSLLRTKRYRQEWEMVCNSELWKVTVRKLFPPLLLSYYDLSPMMRRCFSYCAIFPKDSKIKKDDLIRLWMAQGYFDAADNENMEFVGNQTFNNLAMRSFFQGFEKDENGSIVSCMMHDIIHDCAEFMMEKECLKIEVPGAEEVENVVSRRRNLRHLRLDLYGFAPIPASIYKLKRLRTLMITGRSIIETGIFSQLTCLRTLSLEKEIYFWTPQIEIGKLIHLRYCALPFRNLSKLSDTICNLCNLQTLDIRWYKSPDGIEKLVKLRHLKIFSIPEGIGKLTELRTLVRDDISGSSSLAGLKDLITLNKLQGSLRVIELGSDRDLEEANQVQLEKKKASHFLGTAFSLGVNRASNQRRTNKKRRRNNGEVTTSSSKLGRTSNNALQR